MSWGRHSMMTHGLPRPYATVCSSKSGGAPPHHPVNDCDFHCINMSANMPSNLPNLRRLFVEARTDAEESAYSRNAFYNLVIFMSSIAGFSLVAQRMMAHKATTP
ncbi:hypothetical protein B5807_05789 [Epicoccum nigrum]|uniref:Uncharacterized protein n=1 Tax=Epicoccum nigrum TaxID=105696 RepID=A0A1Y2LZH2_EPING|nr:hypothetical protein B5807_05789 [Epicoccum nigrum]